jgi:hypothetical protein
MTSSWRDERNRRAFARLSRALPEIFPGPVLTHVRSRPFTPPTPRLAIDSYWRNHPVRADRLARALARLSGAPAGWRWSTAKRLPRTFRTPPAPYRETAFSLGPGSCCVCGQPVYRYGWHVDLWNDLRANENSTWHSCCVVAWKLWTSPRTYLGQLRKAQGRVCPATGKRLLKSGEVDHRFPLYRVWREHRDDPWPELLLFWGIPNLQVVNRDGHLRKTTSEACDRAGAKGSPLLSLSVAPLPLGDNPLAVLRGPD